MTKLTSLGALALFSLSLPLAALAAPAQIPVPQTAAIRQHAKQAQQDAVAVHKQVATARAHAMMAANAKSLNKTHLHLHHVVNCLVGPDGADFDSSAGNPCKGMGHGAIVDAAGSSQIMQRLNKALSEAKAGLNSDNEKTAKQAAKKAASVLKEVHRKNTL